MVVGDSKHLARCRHSSPAIDEGAAAHVCGVDVQLTRPKSKPPIVRQAIEITGATEPPLFVTDVRKALAQGTRREA